jgi:ribosomal protein S12 methylthiotransferase accessory factor YcaO
MSNAIYAPVETKRLTPFYIAFRYRNWFVTDNNVVFLLPKNAFCQSCFKRRYLSEFDGGKVGDVSQKALKLAREIDTSFTAGQYWHCVSIENPDIRKTFTLASYESCPHCHKSAGRFGRGEAGRTYESLLHSRSTPKTAELGKLLFSFGFARALHTSNKLGIQDGEIEKILGGNFFSRITGRVVTANEVLVDVTTLGYSMNRALAETKAVMEFLERYAVLEQTCPMHTNEYDEDLIREFLSLYSRRAGTGELAAIKSASIWAVNLADQNACPVPFRFIYDKGDLAFIKPTSSGFAAHVDFRSSLTASILELVERDAFVRFWYDPTRAYGFTPDSQVQEPMDHMKHVLGAVLGNSSLTTKCYVIRSPTKLPVVMATISSSESGLAPALVVGFGVGLNLAQAQSRSMDELRTNALNLLTCISSQKDFLRRQFSHEITSLPDRMNFYSTSRPRARLTFLDHTNPLTDGVYDDLELESLEGVIERLTGHGIGIYGIDVTPRCFADKNVFVTRAFSPHLFPLQFEADRWFNLPTHALSAKDALPHFFT